MYFVSAMNRQEKQFITTVYDYYHTHGRHDLPWRTTTDPYMIAVSEIMLQQTQVARVIEKYHSFLKLFPTVHALAGAPLGSVIAAWSGLGYNRRAKFLHKMAIAVIEKYNGVFPKTIEGLLELPGIGPYTSRAIAAFAYNTPSAFIETNIRTVYIHHFFRDGANVSDAELAPKINATVDHENPRAWYWALMDYGSFLKSKGIASHRVSKHYAKQSTFKGSRRQVRGGILRALIGAQMTKSELALIVQREEVLVESVLLDLLKEGLVQKKGNRFFI